MSADEVLTHRVRADEVGARIDVLIPECGLLPSRAVTQKLIERNCVRVNGLTVTKRYRVHSGDRITVEVPPSESSELVAEDVALDVRFEDESLIVLSKAAGMVVHPAHGHWSGTLVHALLGHSDDLGTLAGSERPGIVHRLDKETSGCLVVAKNDETHLALSKQFAERRVEKIYNAIVCGELARDSGEIRAAITRHSTHRKRMTVCDDDSGRAAHTSWRVLEKLNAATFIKAQIHTGRTHQIRVHFQFLGHPLVGDETYGAKQNKKLAELTGYAAPRVMLHSRELSFIHPRTEKEMSFESPLPEDFREALKLLRA